MAHGRAVVPKISHNKKVTETYKLVSNTLSEKEDRPLLTESKKLYCLSPKRPVQVRKLFWKTSASPFELVHGFHKNREQIRLNN